MSFIHGETITQHTRTITGQDADGNDTFGEVDTTHEHVAVYPRDAGKSGTSVISGVTVLFKAAWVEVELTDEFTIRGRRYKVDGDPGLYHSPITAQRLTKLALSRVEG